MAAIVLLSAVFGALLLVFGRWGWGVLALAPAAATLAAAGVLGDAAPLAGLVVLLLILAAALPVAILVLAQQAVRAVFGDAAAGHFAGVHVVRMVDSIVLRRRRAASRRRQSLGRD